MNPHIASVIAASDEMVPMEAAVSVARPYPPLPEGFVVMMTPDPEGTPGVWYDEHDMRAFVDADRAAAAPAKTRLDHFIEDVEASGEAVKRAALPLSTDMASLQLQLREAIEMAVRDRMLVKEMAAALVEAEAALADIGDADREPGDDVAWCEARAAQALPITRAVLAKVQ